MKILNEIKANLHLAKTWNKIQSLKDHFATVMGYDSTTDEFTEAWNEFQKELALRKIEEMNQKEQKNGERTN